MKMNQLKTVLCLNITIAEAMKLAENNGFFKAKYQVLKVIQYFDVELVLTASDVEYCAELHQFSGGYNVTVLADTPEQDLIAILNSLGILN